MQLKGVFFPQVKHAAYLFSSKRDWTCVAQSNYTIRIETTIPIVLKVVIPAFLVKPGLVKPVAPR